MGSARSKRASRQRTLARCPQKRGKISVNQITAATRSHYTTNVEAMDRTEFACALVKLTRRPRTVVAIVGAGAGLAHLVKVLSQFSGSQNADVGIAIRSIASRVIITTGCPKNIFNKL
jgi:hypothetical protein